MRVRSKNDVTRHVTTAIYKHITYKASIIEDKNIAPKSSLAFFQTHIHESVKLEKIVSCFWFL